jgi:phosphatidate cytidylyltransferase
MFARIAAGLIGVAILVPSLIWGGVIAVDLFVWFALGVGLYEYGRMAFPQEPVLRAGVACGGALVFAASVYLGLGWLGPVLAGLTLAGFLLVMATSTSMDGAADRVGRLILGVLYVGGLLAFVPLIRRFDGGMGWIFVLLAASWLGDTGAYFAGRAFGRHKLAPVLSPKKTWEGAVGGFLTSMGGAVLFAWLCGLEVPWLVMAAMGGVLDIFGVLGDLAESMLKRAFGVKDSGTIMPGHGGILDRIDSVIFAAPVLFLMVSWVIQSRPSPPVFALLGL